MADIFTLLANQAIEEAYRNGAFENLQGAGSPLPDLEGSAMESFMKAKGIVPREVELRKKLAEMKETGAPYEACALLEVEIKILMEQRLQAAAQT